MSKKQQLPLRACLCCNSAINLLTQTFLFWRQLILLGQHGGNNCAVKKPLKAFAISIFSFCHATCSTWGDPKTAVAPLPSAFCLLALGTGALAATLVVQPIAKAVAVEDDKILAVGDRRTVERLQEISTYLTSGTNCLTTCDTQVEKSSSVSAAPEKIKLNTEDSSFPFKEIRFSDFVSESNDFVEVTPTNLTQQQISTQAIELLSADASLIVQESSETDGSAEPAPADSDRPETPDSPTPTKPPQSDNENFWRRSHLTGDGWRSRLRDKGVTFNLEFTQFYQGLAAGTGDNDFDYGGRLDALINLDTGKLGLWEGGGFHTHLEYRFGNLSAFQDGILFPVNTGKILPLNSPDAIVVSSLYFSQQIGDRASLLVGKINVVDLLAGDLFFGGWGTQRFMNIAFVVPPKGVVPPTLMGAIANIKLQPVTLTLMVFDPNDRTDDYWPDDLFSDGVNFSLGATHVGTISGRPTTYALNATYSTKERTDLRDVLLPPGLETNAARQGSYNNAVNPLVDFGDEYGIELYYSYAITLWFYLTGDIQYIDPANQDSDDALVLGLRTRIRF